MNIVVFACLAAAVVSGLVGFGGVTEAHVAVAQPLFLLTASVFALSLAARLWRA
jgi:uncharacterized membrane protein YtjA (UPF0391 family)